MALILIVTMKSHGGQKLYVSGPITSKNGTDQKDFFIRFRLSSRTVERLLEKIEEAIQVLPAKFLFQK
jgi:hypothetical protein